MEQQKEPAIPPEEWDTEELFKSCQLLHIIHPEDCFEFWKEERSRMLEWVKRDIERIH